jgi:hypothetical protein
MCQSRRLGDLDIQYLACFIRRCCREQFRMVPVGGNDDSDLRNIHCLNLPPNGYNIHLGDETSKQFTFANKSV